MLTLDEILVRASGVRLKAVVVTSLTTISGLLPTAYGIGGSDAMLIPMTLAMAWGLTTGTILTLVWVPCAVGILEDLDQLVSKIGKFRTSQASWTLRLPARRPQFGYKHSLVHALLTTLEGVFSLRNC